VNNSAKTLLFLVFAISPLCSTAQTRRGIVKEAGSGSPISGAIIVSKDSSMTITDYATSGDDGAFNINISKTAKSIEISKLGYTTYNVADYSELPTTIFLQSQPLMLKESKITVQKVRVQGDTISYSVPALIDESDKTLADFLKKLPNVDVSSKGIVSYDGKEIQKMYVDGKDVLGKDYTIATNNFDPGDLDEVDILENHQDVKVLEGIEFSNKTSMNIALKKKARGKIITGLEMALGGSAGKPKIPYDGKAFLMNMSGTFQTFNSIGADAAGNDISSGKSGQNNQLHSFSQILATKAPFKDSRSRMNKSAAARTTDNLALKDSLNLETTVCFDDDRLKSFQYSEKTFTIEDGQNKTFRDNDNRHTRNSGMEADIAIKNNVSRQYLQNDLSFYVDNAKGNADIYGTVKRNDETDFRDVILSNEFYLKKKTRKNSIYSISVSTQYCNQSENLSVKSEADTTDIDQSVNQRLFSNKLDIGYNLPIVGNFRMITGATLSQSYRKLASEAIPKAEAFKDCDIPTSNDLSVSSISPNAFASFTYNNRKLKSGLTANLGCDFFEGGDMKKIFTTTGLTLDLTYMLSPRIWWALYVTGSMPAEESGNMYDGLIFNDYQNLSCGMDTPEQLPSLDISGSFNFKHPINGIFASLHLEYSDNKYFGTSRDFLGDYIISRFNNPTRNHTISAVAKFSKSFMETGSRIKLTFGCSKSSSDLYQNGAKYDYTSIDPSISLDFVQRLSNWCKLSYRAGYDYSRYSVDDALSKDYSEALSQNLKIYLKPIKKMSLSIAAEHYYSSLSGLLKKNSVFLDGETDYDISSTLYFFIKADNILNVKEYSYSYVNPLATYTYSQTIRPLNIIAGVHFRF